jgi:hypothetical protein
VEPQDFTLPPAQGDVRSVSSALPPTPAPPPAPVPPEDMGVLQWMLHAFRAFLVWLIEIIDFWLAA